jgi:pilus assembly protein CpaF
VSRLETMILMSGVNLPIMDVRKLIASKVQVIVHLERVPGGSRKVTHITEIRGLDHEQIFFNDLFQYSFDKKDAQGKDIWGLMPVMRNYPLFFKQLDQAGLVTLKLFSREA